MSTIQAIRLIAFAFVSLGAHLIEAPSVAASQALSTVKDCASCPELVAVPALSSTAPSKVLIGRFEVTWSEYLPSIEAAGGPVPRMANGRYVNPKQQELADRLPITGVNYAGMLCYLDGLSKVTGYKYRLPTSAEWEHVARAGVTTNYPWGEALGYNNTFLKGHFDERQYPTRTSSFDPRHMNGLHPVGLLPPNSWGLHDVIGNAIELVEESRPAAPPFCDPANASMPCRSHAARGGEIADPGATPTLSSVRWVLDGHGIAGLRVLRESERTVEKSE